MKTQDILNLSVALKSVDNLTGAKFVYAIAKNTSIVSTEVEFLKSTIKFSEKYEEYNGKRIELAKSLAKKDDKGEPMTQVINGVPNYVLINQKHFEEKLEELKSEYREAVDEQDKKVKEFELLLKEESDLKLFMIDQKDIPANITAGQLSGIILLIKD